MNKQSILLIPRKFGNFSTKFFAHIQILPANLNSKGDTREGG
jgi:hypothetical protein